MGNMELFKLELEPALTLAEDLWLIDLAVYLPETKALVIADLHLGYEEALRREGVLVPPGHLRKVEARLLKILRGLGMSPFPRPERLIINGDLKHSFSPLSRREGEEAEEFLEFAAAEFAELVLLRGNHDKQSLSRISKNAKQDQGVALDIVLQHLPHFLRSNFHRYFSHLFFHFCQYLWGYFSLFL
ncbi:TPA: hypothetical protein EYP12_04955, partial [Candidatus Bipolaricaulota bacterium]|nr:hypothetical protein [Candidatus Bipolaricaulota bacterium]